VKNTNAKKRDLTKKLFEEMNLGVSPKYVTITKDSAVVRVPGSKSKTFSAKKYDGIKKATAAAVAFRDTKWSTPTAPTRTHTKTERKMPIKTLVKKTGAVINTKGLYLDSAENPREIAVLLGGEHQEAKDMIVKKLTIDMVGGDQKAFLYLAAATRNYMEKYKKKPNAGTMRKNIVWAKNKPKMLEEKRSKRTELVGEKAHEIIIDDSFFDKKTFDEVVSESLNNGIITRKSAARKIKKGKNNAKKKIAELGLELDHRYLTYMPSSKHGSVLWIRITTNKGYQKVKLVADEFSSEKDMFITADTIRRTILKEGSLDSASKEQVNKYNEHKETKSKKSAVHKEIIEEITDTLESLVDNLSALVQKVSKLEENYARR